MQVLVVVVVVVVAAAATMENRSAFPRRNGLRTLKEADNCMMQEALTGIQSMLDGREGLKVSSCFNSLICLSYFLCGHAMTGPVADSQLCAP